MSNIRDEISKVIDVRIPPNGYRKYIKEIARIGGFQQRQHEDSLIALFNAVEELEKQVAELQQQLDAAVVPIPEALMKLEADAVGFMQKPVPGVANFTCPKCGMLFDSRIALLGHSRKKDHQDVRDNTKSDPKEPIQSE